MAEKCLAGAKTAGWSGKFTFVCAIIPKEEFVFDEKYKKWWFYEFELYEKYNLIFLKVDHDRTAD